MRKYPAIKEPIDESDYEQIPVMTPAIAAQQRIKMLKEIESCILNKFCSCPTYENYVDILNAVWFTMKKEIELIVHYEEEGKAIEE